MVAKGGFDQSDMDTEDKFSLNVHEVDAHWLQRKLAEAGLTTFTETRVLIGPFRDRAEADRSMEIVKKLGLGGVVVPARP